MIFWSLKFATEGIAEALSYLFIALVLFTLRKPHFWLVGNLPHSEHAQSPAIYFGSPVFILGFLCFQYHNADKTPWQAFLKKNSRLVLVFLLGMMLAWSPWLFRSYQLYGKVVPLTTHGTYTFLWTLGEITICQNDGNTITKNFNQLQNEAPSLFKNDAEASAYAQQFVRQWLREHWQNYPALILERAQQTVRKRRITLTQVSRSELFPNFLNRLLLDKTDFLSLTGILGLLVLLFVLSQTLFILPVVALASWGLSTLFLSEARYIEPHLPLILFGNCVWFLLLTSFIARKPRDSKSL